MNKEKNRKRRRRQRRKADNRANKQRQRYWNVFGIALDSIIKPSSLSELSEYAWDSTIAALKQSGIKKTDPRLFHQYVSTVATQLLLQKLEAARASENHWRDALVAQSTDPKGLERILDRYELKQDLRVLDGGTPGEEEE